MTTGDMTSNKPYLVKAFYDWISDNGLTPYILVDVSVNGVMVPMNFVQNGEIVLNISSGAVGAISLGEHSIEFSARFGGVSEHLYIPYGAVAAIYAQENGAGTSLPIEHPEVIDEPTEPKPKGLTSVDNSSTAEVTNIAKIKSKATLKVIK